MAESGRAPLPLPARVQAEAKPLWSYGLQRCLVFAWYVVDTFPGGNVPFAPHIGSPEARKLVHWRTLSLQMLPPALLLALVVEGYNLPALKKAYEASIDIFPTTMQTSVRRLPDWLYSGELFIFVCHVLAFVAVTAACMFDMRAQRTTTVVDSRRLRARSARATAAAWLLQTAPAFVLFAVVPFRAAIPWDDINENVCNEAFKLLHASYPRMKDYSVAAARAGTVDADFANNPRKFCERAGDRWDERLIKEIATLTNYFSNCSSVGNALVDVNALLGEEWVKETVESTGTNLLESTIMAVTTHSSTKNSNLNRFGTNPLSNLKCSLGDDWRIRYVDVSDGCERALEMALANPGKLETSKDVTICKSKTCANSITRAVSQSGLNLKAPADAAACLLQSTSSEINQQERRQGLQSQRRARISRRHLHQQAGSNTPRDFSNLQLQTATAELLSSWVAEDGCGTLSGNQLKLMETVTKAMETIASSVNTACVDGPAYARSKTVDHMCKCTDFGIVASMASAVESFSYSAGLFNDAVVLTELSVGVLLSLYTSMELLPVSLSILSGIAAALMNLKLFVPTSALLGMLGISTSAANTPITVVLLAMVYQTLGDAYFGACLWLAIVYLGGYALVRPQSLLEGKGADATKVRLHMYTVLCFRIAVGVAAVFCFASFWGESRIIGAASIGVEDLITIDTMISGVIGFVGSSLLSNVAMMDWVVVHLIRVHDHERGLAFSSRADSRHGSPAASAKEYARAGSFSGAQNYEEHCRMMEVLREAAVFPEDRTAVA